MHVSLFLFILKLYFACGRKQIHIGKNIICIHNSDPFGVLIIHSIMALFISKDLFYSSRAKQVTYDIQSKEHLIVSLKI